MRNSLQYPVRKGLFLTWVFLFFQVLVMAQPTFPVNGVANPTTKSYAFTNATLVKDAKTTIQNATLVIKDGKIVAAGAGVAVPKDAVVIDAKGKYIYPSFIDIYSDYGVPTLQRTGTFSFGGPQQLESNKKGAFGWNQAIKPEVNAYELFSADDNKANALRNIGFGAVLTHQKDGISRGTGAFVTLANKRTNFVVLKDKASAHYSLNKGTSTQSYPSSLMGTIALLRQTYYDALWYKGNGQKEGLNLSLKAFNENLSLPQIFEGNDKLNDLRAAKIGEEFGVKYIIKGGVNEYQSIKDIAATKSAFILPLNFPAPIDTDDAADVRFVGLDQLKHWELAPTNPAAFEKAGIEFAFTTADLGNVSEFLGNVRKAIQHGLSEEGALSALTTTPAKLLGVDNLVGSIDAGKVANFIITNGPIFNANTAILQNWINGEQHNVKNELWNSMAGIYDIALNTKSGVKNYTLVINQGGTASLVQGDTIPGKYTANGNLVKFTFTEGKGANAAETNLSGIINNKSISGTGLDAKANALTFKGKFKSELATTPAAQNTPDLAKDLGKVIYPFVAYGNETVPTQEDILIKNATVWTNEKQGILQNTDVLIKGGKISKIGKNLSAGGARVIDGTGKHLTAGIIDEHSHIAAASINEGAQSVTSEVRIADNINPEDINIYRQLSGGVTSSHILHGSANTIGGQTQLLKLRWGKNAEELKFEGADPFIKFALGENVKRSSSTSNVRYPNTRMGVEQVLDDAFTRATDYQNALKNAGVKKGENVYEKVRRDLELDALSDIMNSKMFITMHSYVQSEIIAALRVAEKHNFRVNTLTHILEGYKVADKIKAHGANVSTFSDWWNYKMEVLDAQPYNAYIMHKVGLNVAINSDDAEMARRLNQEAAKSVKFGGMSEEDALKMVTLNPAKMLHVDNRVGSIKEGKDADLVLWSDHPLSIYAMSEKTIVDGVVYFDREKDNQKREEIQAEKARIIKKMADLKRAPGGNRPGGGFARPVPRYEEVLSCMDHTHNHGLLAISEEEEEDHQ